MLSPSTKSTLKQNKIIEEIYGGRSNCYWIESAGIEDAEPLAPLKDDVEADVVVIGGGYTGLATAYYLSGAFPEKKIVILEAARISYGASGRNDGLVLPLVVGAEGIIDRLIEKGRIPDAREVFHKTSAGIDMINEIVTEHEIDCEWENAGALVAAATESQVDIVEKKHRRYKALGLGSDLLSEKDLKRAVGIEGYKAAVKVPVGGMIHPAKLARGMIEPLLERGVSIHEETPAVEVSRGPKVSVRTPEGSVAAPALVLATNAYTSRLGFFRSGILPIHTYNIATEPLSDDRLQALKWRDRRPIHDVRNFFELFRLTADNRIIQSGGDGFYLRNSGLGEDRNHPDYERLKRNLITRFPSLEGVRVTHRWCGHVGLTLDRVPIAGVTGASKNIYYGLGYSGHGVPVSFLAGKLISDLYAGQRTDPAYDFFVNRRPPSAPPEPLRSLAFSLYKRYLRRRDVQ